MSICGRENVRRGLAQGMQVRAGNMTSLTGMTTDVLQPMPELPTPTAQLVLPRGSISAPHCREPAQTCLPC